MGLSIALWAVVGNGIGFGLSCCFESRKVGAADLFQAPYLSCTIGLAGSERKFA